MNITISSKEPHNLDSVLQQLNTLGRGYLNYQTADFASFNFPLEYSTEKPDLSWLRSSLILERLTQNTFIIVDYPLQGQTYRNIFSSNSGSNAVITTHDHARYFPNLDTYLMVFYHSSNALGSQP